MPIYHSVLFSTVLSFELPFTVEEGAVAGCTGNVLEMYSPALPRSSSLWVSFPGTLGGLVGWRTPLLSTVSVLYGVLYCILLYGTGGGPIAP